MLQEDLDNGRCDELLDGLSYFGVTDVIAYHDCDKIEKCGFRKARGDNICLFKL